MGKKQVKHKAPAKQRKSADASAPQSDGKGRAPPRRKPRNKSQYVAGVHDVEEELDRLGLRVHEVEGDGNCLFRAVADQMYGRDGDFAALRNRSVQHMRGNRDSFEPFIEDDEDFDEYLQRMQQDGEWGGNLELQALSLVLRRNVNVHQAGQPVWMIVNFPDCKTAALNLSYHMGEHYNSVRLKDDFDDGPAQSFELEALVTAGSNNIPTPGKSQTLRDSQLASPCNVNEKGAAEAACVAIERLEIDTSPGLIQQIHPSDIGSSGDPATGVTRHDKKSDKPGRNRPCPCGSNKKFKSCCGRVGNKSNAVATTVGMAVFPAATRSAQADALFSNCNSSSSLDLQSTSSKQLPAGV